MTIEEQLIILAQALLTSDESDICIHCTDDLEHRNPEWKSGHKDWCPIVLAERILQEHNDET